MRAKSAVLLVILSLAACSAPKSATPAADPTQDTLVKYSQCMREHGIDWFPDPKGPGQGLQIQVPPNQDKSEMDAASAACKKYLPAGVDGEQASPEQIEQARAMSKCMREHGVPGFPDPDAQGRIQLDPDKIGMAPDDPAFAAADQACARFRPGGQSPVVNK